VSRDRVLHTVEREVSFKSSVVALISHSALTIPTRCLKCSPPIRITVDGVAVDEGGSSLRVALDHADEDGRVWVLVNPQWRQQ